ncbi:UDP-N-acetylmuramate:L-alanyl-gamma-D-glutamyl-meso-diaminopimelate ligase [Endozoicomonas numazuensis]|uniref:UDP-N-acetylmuramate--L-alanyl-gamma-D-glutamyl-meso-2,6-diaminoheptandioate ligase n=1 Tax=Endozoicomonas numazuensis TaxID=1137799 RepID=A0A081NLI7_9GAMM|nr:UDP-N-acetylmuramate:L-alanyl-gamma-D-glutamyl-meso-diaminopimelate ligase [Endozoicomonas numazuensis]KEQ19310.1 UDP-N-acetylmuramate:L-alanyl-gamma-D-glutamyl-meso-diaminopimelate ligase [Endozoicomonas numazuensis]
MHIHILGICGTFMGSLALLARDIGIRVSGSDEHVYPPMSTQLKAQGIQLMQGYQVEHLDDEPDLVVIGNAMSRGNPVVEYVLNKGLAYTSGPQFFAEHILKDKWVMAVAGTHGKTSTSSMLAWVLEHAGMSPGFLIGGIPANFGISARMGETPFFVVEADEYDTAFFDKRSKFVHYHPRTAILNNLEFDHADIFENLAAIQKQFHHLVRTIPGDGRIISPANSEALNHVLEMGCWSELEQLGGEWTTRLINTDGSAFDVMYQEKVVGHINWSLTGEHNVANGLAAIAAARHVGVLPGQACEALGQFKGVKRRMELLADIEGIKVYDDFAHHPTAIETTLKGLRARYQNDRIRAIIEPRSNTMKMGIHGNALSDCVQNASEVIWFQSGDIKWSLDEYIDKSPVPTRVMSSTEEIIDYLLQTSESGDHLVIMSNGGFEGIHQRLLVELNKSAALEKG